MDLPDPPQQVDDPAGRGPHVRAGLGVEAALDVLQEPVVLGDPLLDVPARRAQPVRHVDEPVVRPDVSPGRVQQLGEGGGDADRRPLGLRRGAGGGVEPPVVQLPLQHVGQRAVGVLDVHVQAVQEERDRLVRRGQHRPVLGLAQGQQPEAVGLAHHLVAGQVGEPVGEAAVLVRLVQQALEHDLRHVPGLVGELGAHPQREPGEVVRDLVQGRLAGEPHRPDDEVHRREGELAQVERLIVDARVGRVADEAGDRVGEGERTPAGPRGGVRGGRHHRCARHRRPP